MTPEQNRDHGGHGGAHREPQAVFRLLRLPLQARHAAQQPEVDLLDLDAVPARDHRVGEFVQEDAGEEAQGAQEAESVGGRLAQTRIRVGEVGAAQRPGDQPDDEQPQRMDADGDAQEAADPDGGAAHDALVLSLGRAAARDRHRASGQETPSWGITPHRRGRREDGPARDERPQQTTPSRRIRTVHGLVRTAWPPAARDRGRTDLPSGKTRGSAASSGSGGPSRTVFSRLRRIAGYRSPGRRADAGLDAVLRSAGAPCVWLVGRS